MHHPDRVAQKYGMACLLHEKPFAGVNGSGKHVNWSMGGPGGQPARSGRQPAQNAQFLVFCAAVIRAVHLYADLLRAAVAHAGNDHRLGANEAPPAIISVFLGDQLTDIFEQSKRAARTRQAWQHADHRRRHAAAAAQACRRPQPHQPLRLHRQPIRVPRRRLQPVDRRPPGRAQYDRRRIARLRGHRAGEGPAAIRRNFHAAVQKVLAEICKDHKAVVFNGDGYSAEWHAEAEKRGLPNLKNTLNALPALIADKNHQAVREVQRTVTTRNAQPLRHLRRAVLQGHQHGKLDRADHGQDGNPAGRPYVSRPPGRNRRGASSRWARRLTPVRSTR